MVVHGTSHIDLIGMTEDEMEGLFRSESTAEQQKDGKRLDREERSCAHGMKNLLAESSCRV
jgi:hypothetical protein